MILLVNTGNTSLAVRVHGGGGATHFFIDEAHGHGDVPPGQEVLAAEGTLTLSGFGVSIIRLV